MIFRYFDVLVSLRPLKLRWFEKNADYSPRCLYLGFIVSRCLLIKTWFQTNTIRSQFEVCRSASRLWLVGPWSCQSARQHGRAKLHRARRTCWSWMGQQVRKQRSWCTDFISINTSPVVIGRLIVQNGMWKQIWFEREASQCQSRRICSTDSLHTRFSQNIKKKHKTLSIPSRLHKLDWN